jgi:hypothetical protein
MRWVSIVMTCTYQPALAGKVHRELQSQDSTLNLMVGWSTRTSRSTVRNCSHCHLHHQSEQPAVLEP